MYVFLAVYYNLHFYRKYKCISIRLLPFTLLQFNGVWPQNPTISFQSNACKSRIRFQSMVPQNISGHLSDVWVSYQLRYALKAIFRVGRLHKLVPDNLDWHLWAGRHGGIRPEICVARTPQTLIRRTKVDPATGCLLVCGPKVIVAQVSPWRQRGIAHTNTGAEAGLLEYLGFTVRFRDRW